MSLRTRLPLLILAALLNCLPVRAATPVPGDDVAPAIAAGEAQRLYEHANDYVNNIGEGDYSYAYIQFHWKRAEANVERILRAYPDSPTAKALKAGELNVGPFKPAYFKERVLFRLEEKRLAAVDAVNCAIFLCETQGAVWTDARRTAVARILEVLSRQKRWGEAMKFPVLDTDLMLKLTSVFRVAARFEQNDLVKELLANTPKAGLTKMHAILGEAYALRGRPRTEIAALLDKDPDESVKLAVLSGMIQREVKIQLSAALRLPAKDVYLTGDNLKHPEVRDNVNAVERTFFPGGNAAAEGLLATYRAALGESPAASAPVEARLAYLEYLAAFEKFDELSTYLGAVDRSDRTACELKAIELFAQAGRMQDAERYRAPYAAAGGDNAELAVLAEFRGQMNSGEQPLTVHEKTLAELPFKSPVFLAQAIMEWSLSPNRSIRGAAPYDSVVQKFAPGFENIPAPKSNAVRDAASTQKPY
jgi:hypothetical protein